MFKVPCCCVTPSEKKKKENVVSLCSPRPARRQNLLIFVVKYPPPVFNVLNTLSGLNLFTSSSAADTCQTPKEERSRVEGKNTVQT